jgi:hypothetical protein
MQFVRAYVEAAILILPNSLTVRGCKVLPPTCKQLYRYRTLIVLLWCCVVVEVYLVDEVLDWAYSSSFHYNHSKNVIHGDHRLLVVIAHC